MSARSLVGYTSWEEYDMDHDYRKKGYDIDRRGYRDEMMERMEQSRQTFQRWQAEAMTDQRLLAGDQNYGGQIPQGPYNSTPPATNNAIFNKLLLADNMIGGWQKDNRLASRVYAEHEKNQRTADQHDEVLQWCFEKDSTYEKISSCFDSARTTGLALQAIWLDKSKDGQNGQIRSSRLTSGQFMMDPYWENQDLTDCGWITYRRYMHRMQAADSLPEMRDEIMRMPIQTGQSDNQYPYMSYNYNLMMKDMLPWDEYWKLTWRPQEFVVDLKGNEMLWKTGEDGYDDLMSQTYYSHPGLSKQLRMIKRPWTTVERVISVNNQPLYSQIKPWGLDRYPFVAYMCYHYPELADYSMRYQGIIRGGRSSQEHYNRRMTASLQVLESVATSGMKIKEGALVKDENAFVTGPGRIWVVAKGADMSHVEPIRPPDISQGMIMMQEKMGDETLKNLGVTETMLGIAESKDISGMMLKLKMGAGLTVLRGMFDRLNMSQKFCSEIFLELEQNNFSVRHIYDILGEVPDQEFATKDFRNYGCRIGEGLLTNTQRQLEFIQMIQIEEVTGRKVPAKLLLKTSSLTHKEELGEAWEQEDQQQSEAAQQAQRVQIEQAQAGIKAMEARAVSDEAGARERDTRAMSNIGLMDEREAMAEHDRVESQFTMAKTVKELEGMEQSQLIETLQFMESLRQNSRAEKNEDEDRVQQRAEAAERRTNAKTDSRPKPKPKPSGGQNV